MSLVRQMRGGKDYDSAWGTRMHGTGELANLIATRFRLACRRFGFNHRHSTLDTTLFHPPRVDPAATAVINDNPRQHDLFS